MTWWERFKVKRRIRLLRRDADDLYSNLYDPSLCDSALWREIERLRNEADALEMELNHEGE